MCGKLAALSAGMLRARCLWLQCQRKLCPGCVNGCHGFACFEGSPLLKIQGSAGTGALRVIRRHPFTTSDARKYGIGACAVVSRLSVGSHCGAVWRTVVFVAAWYAGYKHRTVFYTAPYDERWTIKQCCNVWGVEQQWVARSWLRS